MQNEGSQDSWDSRPLKGPYGVNTAWNIKHEKAEGAMDEYVSTVTNTQYCFSVFKRYPKEFLRRLEIVDETWLHWYTAKTREQMKQWTSLNEHAPK